MNSSDHADRVASGAISTAKVGTAWVGLGVSQAPVDWNVWAAKLTFAYTACMFSHWVWKTFVRPWMEDRGWLKPRSKKRRSGGDE